MLIECGDCEVLYEGTTRRSIPRVELPDGARHTTGSLVQGGHSVDDINGYPGEISLKALKHHAY